MLKMTLTLNAFWWDAENIWKMIQPNLPLKTDLTRESTAVLHSTLSILLVNIYARDHGLLYSTDTKVSAVQYQVKSSLTYFEIFYQHQYIKT